MGKKILLITILIIFSTSIFSFAEENLYDIQDHWGKEYIDYLINLEGISGYPDGQFKPNNTIKVSEFTKILVVTLGFKDIDNSSEGHWSLNYVNKAIQLGIIKKDEFNNEFKNLDKNITRAEIARMISRKTPESSDDIDKYKNLIADYNYISDEYKPYVLKVFKEGIITGYSNKEFKPTNYATRAEACTMIARLLDSKYRRIPVFGENSNASIPATSYVPQNFIINNKTIKAEVITIDLNNPKIHLKTSLAKGKIGSVEDLKNIALKHNAVAAINGSYFGAYTEDKDTYGVLAVDGKVLHNGNDRSVFGFDKNNNVDIDVLNTKIKGYNGKPKWKYSWNGYWINHTPIEGGESVIVYTPERGDRVRSDLGTNVIVKEGKIVDIVDGDVDIPKNGLVVNLYGSVKELILDRFVIGNPLNYNVDLSPIHGNNEFWENIEGAVGAGPGLVWDGKVNLNLEKEKFTDSKITSIAAARSAIGFTKDRSLILLTTRSATINDLAQVMVKLGCDKAMNLDGGASSGLYYKGEIITKPGRQISNAILIIEE